jgi:hypothetical protein
VEGWLDLPAKTRLFALEYAKNSSLAAASKRVKVSQAVGQELLDHPLVSAYIDDLVSDEETKSAITREFIEYHMLETLGQVNGDDDIPLLTKDGTVEGRNFNAPAKIRLLQQMQEFVDVRSRPRSSLTSRVVPGQPRTFSSPDELWAACAEFFAWVEENPIMDARVEVRGGREQEVRTPRPRIPTEGSLVIFIGARMDDWNAWAENPEFAPVVEAARGIITEIKMTHAAAGIMNPNFVARDLGMADNINNPDGHLRAPSIDFSKLSLETLKELKQAQKTEED